MRRLTSTALFWLCSLLDLIPWREDGRWYRFGLRGCAWGVSRVAVRLDKKP